MIAVICPICTGSGIVPQGFYNRTSDTFANAGGTEMCRGCGGKGWVCIPGEDNSNQKIKVNYTPNDGTDLFAGGIK